MERQRKVNERHGRGPHQYMVCPTLYGFLSARYIRNFARADSVSVSCFIVWVN